LTGAVNGFVKLLWTMQQIKADRHIIKMPLEGHGITGSMTGKE